MMHMQIHMQIRMQMRMQMIPTASIGASRLCDAWVEERHRC